MAKNVSSSANHEPTVRYAPSSARGDRRQSRYSTNELRGGGSRTVTVPLALLKRILVLNAERQAEARIAAAVKAQDTAVKVSLPPDVWVDASNLIAAYRNQQRNQQYLESPNA